MSIVKRNDFKRIGGGQLIRVRNRIQVRKRKKIKFQTQIGNNGKKAI